MAALTLPKARTYIAVIGKGMRAGDPPLPEKTVHLAREVGRLLAKANAIVVCGGLGGVMEATAEGVAEASGVIIGILPQGDRSQANPYLTYALPSGLGYLRNYVVIHSSQAVIMIGGGNGTLQEVTIAHDAQRPVVILAGSGGWADRLPALLHRDYLDERRETIIKVGYTPEEVVSIALNLATKSKRL